MTFLQEYGLETLWHEVLHNNQRFQMPASLSVGHWRLTEGLTQVIARQTYPEFLSSLGVSAAYLQEIRVSGPGYPATSSRLSEVLRRLGFLDIRHTIADEVLAALRRINVETTHVNIRELLALELAALSGGSASEIDAWLLQIMDGVDP
jgi:hypothetical protein